MGIPEFQSTPSAWRETCYGYCKFAVGTFQSTPSAWRETDIPDAEDTRQNHFNPLPPHGGRRDFAGCFVHLVNISIHSLRMEGDQTTVTFGGLRVDFNPLPPHGGRRAIFRIRLPISAFQSTPSAWRETWNLALLQKLLLNFNPLPPHGGRRHSNN